MPMTDYQERQYTKLIDDVDDKVDNDLIVSCPVAVTTYIEENTRNLDQNVWGNIRNDTSTNINSGAPRAINIGISRIMLVVTSGTDTTGIINFSGDTVDRDTGSVTSSDSEDMTISGTSTDSSDTDAQGNNRWAFSNAYITSKWFKGLVNMTTTAPDDVNLSYDLYTLSYHQFDDKPNVVIDTFDMTMTATNTSAWFYGYLYKVEKTSTGIVAITREASLEVASGSVLAAPRIFRLRRGSLNITMDGSDGDGFFTQLHFGPAAVTYWQNISMWVYGYVRRSVQVSI